ncbi:hypothetical protein ACFLSQ_11520, partial [Bacteroidota bacterium]
RVITPKPPISEPVVSAPTYVACFDKVPPAFEFTISPFQGKGTNAVEGRVLDPDGMTVARVTCQPLDEIASADVTPPTRGGRQEWRGIIDKELSPGKYKMEVTHKLHGKSSKNDLITLEVFTTGLTKTNKKEIDFILDNNALYGFNLGLTAIPTSGGKIKSNQFRLYFYTDKNQQKPPFGDDKVFLDAGANELTCQISWVQPYTNREVVLFPLKTVPINQETPNILTGNQSVSISGTAKKIRIKVSGLSIKPVEIGDKSGTAKPQIRTKVGNSKVEIDGFDLASEPVIEEDNGNYTITMEITGKLARGEDMIFGNVSCVMTATAINPINGKSSDGQKRINIPLSYEPEKESRGRGGGGRPPSGGKPKR